MYMIKKMLSVCSTVTLYKVKIKAICTRNVLMLVKSGALLLTLFSVSSLFLPQS